MKNYRISVPKANSKTNEAIKDVFIDGGFTDNVEENKNEIIYCISCNSDTEFAECCIEVGKYMERFKNA